MDLNIFLSSLNKISVWAFLLVFLVIIYEFYLLEKEKKKKAMPKIPEFKDTQFTNISYTPLIINDQKLTEKKSNKPTIFILLFLLVIFGLISVFGLKNIKIISGEKQNIMPTPITSFVYSNGVTIFDINWKEFPNQELKNIRPGDRIIIGIDKLDKFDIDMARIKVNEQDWKPEHTTLNYNQDYDVFYQEYTVASDEAVLKIAAQLHSRTQDWLGQ